MAGFALATQDDHIGGYVKATMVFDKRRTALALVANLYLVFSLHLRSPILKTGRRGRMCLTLPSRYMNLLAIDLVLDRARQYSALTILFV